MIIELSSRFLDILTPIDKGIDLGLFNSLLNFYNSLWIKVLYVLIKDLLDLCLIISILRNSLLSFKLVISSLEDLVKSLLRLLTNSRLVVNTSKLSTYVANIIGLVLYKKNTIICF